ncbi:predicted protein [Chaetoceros tenuissimus]|uniref:Uncharacterized protein n=1 Tax=Chaetoceros tenuissimus TaxID=426638 RepID=A0AAD3HAZ4_9STRA|nr:predicted protein [Chaetoceros tenuissimus]
MRVATVDGLVTLFYDGSKDLFNHDLHSKWFVKWNEHGLNEDEWEEWDLSTDCKNYWRERDKHGSRVIFANTVIRIERFAFICCKRLAFIKWSINLEFIGQCALSDCNLSSVFVPPRCREIRDHAFACNCNLKLLNVPQNTNLVEPHWIIRDTVLYSKYELQRADPELDVWLKNINDDDEFALHRVCASFEPTLDMILHTMKEKGGPKAFKVENNIGITPSQYLKENPYATVTEKEIIEKYVLQMMGELQSDQEVL